MFNKTIQTLFILCLLILGFACNSNEVDDSASLLLFSKIASTESGIHFSNDLIDDPLDKDRNVLSYYNYFNGGGVAISDFNNDGLQDIIFTGNEVKNRLYINKGNLKFEDITESAGINEGKKWTTGVTTVDINRDGYMDIYFCQSSQFDKSPNQRKNLLFINNKDLTFTERAEEYGLDDKNISEQAVFFDMDNDDDLDCFVLNNSVYPLVPFNVVFEHLKDKNNYAAACSNLYRNDNGKFKRITEEAGLLNWGYGLGVGVSDLNNDGLLDIYQANDYSVPDFMYINQGNGKFKDEIKTRTKNVSWFSMGCDIADINNDLQPDIGVVDMAATDHVRGKTLMASMDPNLFYYSVNQLGYQRQHMFNSLQLNNGDGTFNNIAGLAGLISSEWSWAALFADFDNDGWKDYFISNGYRRYSRDNDSRIRLEKEKIKYKDNIPASIKKEIYEGLPQVKIPNYLYKNKGGFAFEEVGDAWGISTPSFSNGASYADLDNDGDLDLIVNNVDEEAFIFRNNSTANYLDIELNSDSPIEGSKVIIEAGSQKQMVEVFPSRGFQSAVGHRVHFGLGNVDKVDKIEVIWPDQSKTVQTNISGNQMLKISKQNTIAHSNRSTKEATLISLENESLFSHTENPYYDYEKEVLVPYAQSALGPFISTADVNNDNRTDFFVGGAKGQSGSLFLQKANGSFAAASSQIWNADKNCEDMGNHFFDADGDGDLDLYVISAGNEVAKNDPSRHDRLYINNGNGAFSKSSNQIPLIESGGSKVKSADIDNDGDLDLFVAGRLEPKNYPNPSKSTLLENRNGKFVDVTTKWSDELEYTGLINDFVWEDINNDKLIDLIVAGEWMPVKVYINSGSSFENQTSTYIPGNLSGWNYSIKAEDIDQDGDRDLIVGNLGLNSKFKASKKKPLKLLANDFDNNGTCDIVLAKEYKGKTVPVRGRQCSSEQMPFILDKFKNYEDFAHASIEDILTESKISEGLQLKVENLESGIYFRNGNTFTFKALPIDAQKSMISGIEVVDLNKDGLKDIIVAGNLYNMEIETPPLDAGEGLILLQKPNGEFDPVTPIQSGFKASRDVKDMQLIKLENGKTGLLVANNNSALQLFKIQK